MSRDPVKIQGGATSPDVGPPAYPDKYVIETKVGTERGLLPNTRYVVRTRAVNNLGVTSEWSDALEFDTSQDTTIPDDVKNAQVTLDSSTGNITLTWDKVDTNEDGSPLLDFAYYEIVFEDPISYPAFESMSAGVIPPFTYSSITESYTLLNSTNKAIHSPYGQGASQTWNIAIYATDYSGNRSVPTYVNIDPDDWESYDPSGDPVTLQSTDYDGVGGVAANDATDGWRLEVGGLAEFNELRTNSDLEVVGHSFLAPPIAIFTMNESNNPAGRQTFANTNWDPIHWDNNALNNDIDGSNIVSYSVGTGIHTINASGWYRITISHRWIVDGVGARHTEVEINGATIKALGGHPGGGSLATELNNYTDVRCFNLSSGDELVFSAMEDSGGYLDLVYAQLIIEWLSN